MTVTVCIRKLKEELSLVPRYSCHGLTTMDQANQAEVPVCLASSFLGAKIMLDMFNRLKLWPFMLCNYLSAIVRPSLILSQQSWKNRPMKPSGFGALSPVIERIVSFISFSVKVHLGSKWVLVN